MKNNIQPCNEINGAVHPPSPLEEFVERAHSYSLKLYRDSAEGTLRIQLPQAKENSYLRSPVALITEHRPVESQQHSLSLNATDGATSIRLPAGDYSVVVCAYGYEPFRAFTTVTAGCVSTIQGKLLKLDAKATTFEQVLVKNMIQRDARSLRNLSVAAGQTLVLDSSAKQHNEDREYVALNTLKDLKQVLGCPDSAFIAEHPRFGGFSARSASPDYPVSEGLDFAQRAALQEYVYGNSKSVAGWETNIDKWVSAEKMSVSLFALADIDVGPNATLYVTSSGLVCNTLSVHYTGRVRFNGPGPTKIEMMHYVRYGLFESRTVNLQGGPTMLAHQTG
jgi:hypothetical protein